MTQLEGAATNTSTEGATAGQERLVLMTLAAMLMATAAIILIVIAVWALNFDGVMSKELKRALDGNSLTTAGVVFLVVGVVLLVCVAGLLVGPKVNRWVGLLSRMVGIVIGALGAISGLWLVAYYPGWAITCTVLGALIVYTLTSYERELRSPWPWAPLRAQAAQVFSLNTKGIDVPRGAAAVGLYMITLVVMSAQNLDKYFLSAAFGLLYVSLSDPGGRYLSRARRMAVVAAIGTLLTALGYGIGGDAWGLVVVVTFVVTVVAGLAINFGQQALVAGVLLNVWFLIALASAVGLPARVHVYPWNQALAWLIGSAIAIALMSALWLGRGMGEQPSPLPEIRSDVPPIKLSRPIVLFVLIRAVAVASSVAIAFGLSLDNADWMPLATLVAMKPNLQQATLRGVQRLVGAALGGAIAAVFLVTVTSHRALEEIFVLLAGVGVSIYAVNYAFYTAAIAGAVLIALDLPHPTNLGAEGRRVFFTFAGVAIAVFVMFLASLLQKRQARATAHQEA